MPDVTENTEEQRYEIRVDGELAGFAEWRGRERVRAFTHTEIDPRFEGQGLGSQLIAAVLDDQRATGHNVVPICPFVHAYLSRHPEYLDVVEPHIQRAFHLV